MSLLWRDQGRSRVEMEVCTPTAVWHLIYSVLCLIVSPLKKWLLTAHKKKKTIFIFHDAFNALLELWKKKFNIIFIFVNKYVLISLLFSTPKIPEKFLSPNFLPPLGLLFYFFNIIVYFKFIDRWKNLNFLYCILVSASVFHFFIPLFFVHLLCWLPKKKVW